MGLHGLLQGQLYLTIPYRESELGSSIFPAFSLVTILTELSRIELWVDHLKGGCGVGTDMSLNRESKKKKKKKRKEEGVEEYDV
jgi:hypothetical protein